MLARAGRSALRPAASRFARFHEPAALSLSTKAESHAPASSDCATSGQSGAAAVAVAVAVPPSLMAAPASLTFDQKPEGRVKFMAEEKDLESDQALWALYERWCKAFDQERDREEMARRFDRFKKTVLYVQHINKAYPSHKPRTITKFADGKLRTPCGCSRSPLLKRMAEELDDNPCELIVGDDDKLYKRVFADYKLVDGRLYVHLPKGVDVKTITTNPEWPTSEC